MKLLISLTAAAFAFAWTLYAGSRGFLPFDQSIPFDGGFRVASGQVLYRDFATPMGPLLFWIQGAVFHFFGVSYFNYIATAAAMNAVAAVLAWRLVDSAGARQGRSAGVAAFVTAAWFYPPFGTPWFEQTASLFGLAMLVLLCRVSPRRPAWRAAAAGACVVAAALCKQNCGIYLFLVGLVLAAALPRFDRPASKSLVPGFLAGAATATVLLCAFVYTTADWPTFWRFFVEIPRALGRERVVEHARSAVKTLFVGRDTSVPQIYCNLALLGFFCLAIFGWKNRAIPRAAKSGRAALLAIGCIFYQNLLIQSTNNQPANGFPLLGVVAGLALAEFSALRETLTLRADWGGQRAWPTGKPLPAIAGVALALAGAGLFAKGLGVGLSREVHDEFEHSTFDARCESPLLSEIRWGRPTPVGAADLRAADVDQLYQYLKERGGRFFIFKDLTVFYPMLGVAPPQPIPWFHRGLTYPKDYAADIDRWIVDSLKSAEIRTVVVELESFRPELGTSAPAHSAPLELGDFPLLGQYMSGEFEQKREIGFFAIYEKRS
jgi:hypothetical protein